MRKLLSKLTFAFLFSFFFNPHIIAQDTLTYSVQDTSIAKNLSQEARVLLGQGNLDVALSKLNKALDICHQIGQAQSLITVDLLILKASIFYFRQSADSVIALSEKALEIRIKHFGPEHPAIIESYNGLGIAHATKNDFIGALPYFQKALKLQLNIAGKKTALAASLYNNIGLSYGGTGQLIEGIEYLMKGLELRREIFGGQHPEVAQSYFNLGNYNSFLGEEVQAGSYFEQALQIARKVFGGQHPTTANFYIQLGNHYTSIGDFSKGILFLNNAIGILTQTFGQIHPTIAEAYQGLGLAYIGFSQYEQAIESYEKSLDIRQQVFGKKHVRVADTYTGLAATYGSMKAFDESQQFLDKALEIQLNHYGIQHPVLATIYFNIGSNQANQEAYDTALENYQKALDLYHQMYGSKHPIFATLYRAMAVSTFMQAKFVLSTEYFDQAAQVLGYYEKGQWQQVSALSELLSLISTKAYLKQLRFLAESKREHLDVANSWYDELQNAIDYYLRSIGDLSQKSITPYLSSAFYGMLNNKYLLFQATDSTKYITEAFAVSERSKAFLLKQALLDAQARSYAKIPDSLVQQERALRRSLASYDKQEQYFKSVGTEKADSALISLNGQRFEVNQQYERFKDNLENNYPQYHSLKYNYSTTPLSFIKDSLLKDKEALVEYFVGDTSIFAFLIQPNHIELHQIAKDPNFDNWIQDMTQKGIYAYYGAPTAKQSPRLKESSLKNYSTAAHQLYQTLIEPFQEQLKSTKKLFVVPDGKLGYIPFEALLKTKPPKPTAIPAYQYLLEDFQISYCFSGTLLQEMQNKKHVQQPTESLLGLAPFFLDDADSLQANIDTTVLASLALRDKFGPLPASGLETATAAKIFKGQPYYGYDATLERFKEEASKFRILHLSTHGKADDRVGDYAYLAFKRPGKKDEFDKLYARDIYEISLNADLVVLSACETGIGKLQRGEGIISLARAFAYAGAKSMLTTLWKVSDSRTQDLITNFYGYLSNQQPKDKAIYKAKLDFIQKHKGDPELRHPFFWAAMIGIGDMQPLR